MNWFRWPLNLPAQGNVPVNRKILRDVPMLRARILRYRMPQDKTLFLNWDLIFLTGVSYADEI